MRFNRYRNTDRITQAFFRSFFTMDFLFGTVLNSIFLNSIKNDSISFQHNSAKMTLVLILLIRIDSASYISELIRLTTSIYSLKTHTP